jgi:hypothetical protein
MAVHRYAHKILAERSRFDRLRGRVSWHRNRPVPIHTRNRKQGGTADVYMGLEFLDGLAEKLNGFPRTVTDIRDVTIGGFGPRSAGGVGMKFHCVDGAGHAVVEARIDSGDLSGLPRQTASLIISVGASAVDSFVEELRRVGPERAGIARLKGLPTAHP